MKVRKAEEVNLNFQRVQIGWTQKCGLTKYFGARFRITEAIMLTFSGASSEIMDAAIWSSKRPLTTSLEIRDTLYWGYNNIEKTVMTRYTK